MFLITSASPKSPEMQNYRHTKPVQLLDIQETCICYFEHQCSRPTQSKFVYVHRMTPGLTSILAGATRHGPVQGCTSHLHPWAAVIPREAGRLLLPCRLPHRVSRCLLSLGALWRQHVVCGMYSVSFPIERDCRLKLHMESQGSHWFIEILHLCQIFVSFVFKWSHWQQCKVFFICILKCSLFAF